MMTNKGGIIREPFGPARLEMSTKEEGAAAIEKFNGQELVGRALKVNEAKQRENRIGF